MLAEMSTVELGTWLALYGIDPWGEERADLRAGIIASQLWNVHGNKSVPADFMPYAERETKPDGGPSLDLDKRIRAALQNATQRPIKKRSA